MLRLGGLSGVVLEFLFAALVTIGLPLRAWRRGQRAEPPSPPALYIAEVLLLTAALAGLLWRHGVPLDAIGLAPVAALRRASNLLLCVTAIVGVDVCLVWRITRRLRTAVIVQHPTGLAADALSGNRAGASFALVTVGGAIWEELCFRAAVFAVLPHTVPGILLGVVGGAVAFGAQHLRNGRSGMAYSTIFGVFFALLFLATGDLISVIAAHAVGNLLTAWQWAPRIERARRQALARIPQFLG